jgi:pyridoxal phosphate enzyme (YggS family)
MPAGFEMVAENVERLRERIARAANRVGRSGTEVALLAVSKTYPSAAIQAAYAAGIREFGENRVQEWEAKRAELAALDAKWHFIGHLQSNKARRAVQTFDLIDSIDTMALARKVDSAAAEENKRLPVLIEVHLGEEATKSGVAEAELHPLAQSLVALPRLELRGLMTIPPYLDEPDRLRPYFRKLRELRDALSNTLGRPLPALSMGMSHDFEIAIEEGATEVRIGSALFGERGPKSLCERC